MSKKNSVFGEGICTYILLGNLSYTSRRKSGTDIQGKKLNKELI